MRIDKWRLAAPMAALELKELNMTKEGPGRWVKRSAFAMPLLPAELGINPYVAALLHCAAFLELSDEDAVDPDAAVEAMESLSAYMQRLPPKESRTLQETLVRISAYGRRHGYPEELLEFLEGFLENVGSSDDD